MTINYYQLFFFSKHNYNCNHLSTFIVIVGDRLVCLAFIEMHLCVKLVLA